MCMKFSEYSKFYQNNFCFYKYANTKRRGKDKLTILVFYFYFRVRCALVPGLCNSKAHRIVNFVSVQCTKNR